MQFSFYNSVLHFDKVMPPFKSYLQSILDNMSVPLCKFYTNEWMDFFKLYSNFHPNRGNVQIPSYHCTIFVKDIGAGMNRIQR